MPFHWIAQDISAIPTPKYRLMETTRPVIDPEVDRIWGISGLYKDSFKDNFLSTPQ